MSLFDPQRFDIQQGFSMSMMSMGNQSVSVAGYTNKITYWANDNLKFNANILLYQPSINSFNHHGIKNNGPKIALMQDLFINQQKILFYRLILKIFQIITI